MNRGIWSHLGASVLAIAAASCGGSVEFESVTSDDAEVGVNPIMPLLELSEDSLFATRYAGTRLITSRFFEGGQEVVLSYREAVAADGAGNFSVDLVELLSFVPDPTLFQATFDTREGFQYRYRDFQFRDLFTFYQSYIAIDLDMQVQVAGRTAEEVRVMPDGGNGTYFDVALDAETGLVLRSVEFDAAGVEVHRMEFETFDADPDLSAAVWFQASSLETALDPSTGDLDEQAGFPVLAPTILPDGYLLWKAATLVDDHGVTWAKLTYTDGIDPLFFLHKGLVPAVAAPGGGAISGTGTTTLNDRVWTYPIGPVQVVEGTVRGQELIVLGKEDADALIHAVESAIP